MSRSDSEYHFCYKCKNRFSTNEELVSHRRISHHVRADLRVFNTMVYVQRSNRDVDRSPFFCPVDHCKYGTPDEVDLQAHVNIVHLRNDRVHVTCDVPAVSRNYARRDIPAKKFRVTIHKDPRFLPLHASPQLKKLEEKHAQSLSKPTESYRELSADYDGFEITGSSMVNSSDQPRKRPTPTSGAETATLEKTTVPPSSSTSGAATDDANKSSVPAVTNLAAASERNITMEQRLYQAYHAKVAPVAPTSQSQKRQRQDRDMEDDLAEEVRRTAKRRITEEMNQVLSGELATEKAEELEGRIVVIDGVRTMCLKALRKMEEVSRGYPVTEGAVQEDGEEGDALAELRRTTSKKVMEEMDVALTGELGAEKVEVLEGRIATVERIYAMCVRALRKADEEE
ncbi:hypothetical protein BJ508DRAFT_335037 [Ascobolus immersus RN42]|uniref:C2H2-type domain-containing protein n=1 Tax=Ascobolus immersus RN42 TaxID=1160509 RepID=A0A3N4HIF3_ASCIM|nr:hypothetical protein BJ508DRAFT_335037 [Ascobolus immersus RN42]